MYRRSLIVKSVTLVVRSLFSFLRFQTSRNITGMSVVAALLLCSTSPLQAGGGPENVLLVVNSNSPTSMAVANLYVKLRKIPAMNVVKIAWTGSKTEISTHSFRTKILSPIIKTMSKRKIAGQIDYIVYSSDFPYKIDASGDVVGAFPKHLTPKLSLNSATYFWQKVLRKDASLLSIRNNQYMRYDGKRVRDARSHGFRSWYGWSKLGARDDNNGERYMLSTMLAVTTSRGNTFNEVSRYLTSAAGADGSKPRGYIYFARNKADKARSGVREPHFALAVQKIKAQGASAVIVDEKVPLRKGNVAGTMMGVDKFKWGTSGSVILPGAICDHLTSFGGMIQFNTSQTKLTEYLKYGAAGASGTVVEPYSIQDKFPIATIHVHYTKGCSLAESFYQSVFGPFQLLIVGDPLCQPWATFPKVDASGITSGEKISGVKVITPKVVRVGTSKVSNFELFVDGVRVQRCRAGGKFELDTRTLSDGYHELRVVGIDDSLVQVQGRKIIPIEVNNHNLKITLSGPLKRIRLGQQVKIDVHCPGASKIVLLHQTTVLGSLSAAKGEITIDTKKISHGAVQIQAIARVSDENKKQRNVFSRPLTLNISAK